jgi:hypothetical protein
MKQLWIEIHHLPNDSARNQAVAELVQVIADTDASIVPTIDIQKGDDYTNFLIPFEVWENAQFKLKSLKIKMIVVCEGERGWDDYLLLHHFDKRQKLDKPPI